MKTVDLPVGTHVSYNRGSTSYEDICEAFVIAHRPKGTKYSSWGGRTGNSDTIGVAYARTYFKTTDGRQIWEFTWVRPASIVEPWADYQLNQKMIKDHQNAIAIQRKQALKNRKDVAAEIPLTVRSLFSDFEWDRLVERDQTSTFTFSISRLQRIIEAAQSEVPDVKAARIQAEVESALALL